MPGRISRQPDIGAENAMVQPLAWKNGTTGMMVSCTERSNASGVSAISECSTLERCE